MKPKKLTVIMAVTNEENLDNSVMSYKKAISVFEEVEIYVADTLCTEESSKALKRLKSASFIKPFEAKGYTKAQCYNTALEKITNGYVCFTDSDVTVDKKCWKFIKKSILAHPEDSVEISVKTLNKEQAFIGYSKLSSLDNYTDVTENPFNAALALFAYFFNTNNIKNLRFDEAIGDEALKKFILDSLLLNPMLSYSNKHYCYSLRALENDSAIFDGQYSKDYYTKSVRDFMTPYMTKLKEKYSQVPVFVQYALTKLILAKFANNYYENNKGVLEKDEVLEFYDAVIEAITYIDNAVFTSAAIRCKYINRSLWVKILTDKCKHTGENFSIKLVEEDSFRLVSEGCEDAHITTLKSVYVIINQINYIDGKLEFDAEFTGKDFINAKDIELYVNYDGKKVKLEEYDSYPLLKCFDIPYARKYNMHFFVPVTDTLKEISFSYVYQAEEHPVSLQFAGQFSRIRLRFGKAFWKFSKDKALRVNNNGENFVVFKTKGVNRAIRELMLWVSMLLHSKGIFFGIQCIALRFIYFLTKPFFSKKRIWITFDKLYKAGDNGEYFYRYANTIDDDVQVYYVVSDTSPDYKRLKAYDKKHTVVHQSLKCRLLALNAEAIVATHALVMQYCGFPRYLWPNFVDLFNAKVICIQHGLTVQQLAQYQRRNYDNTTLYCLASKYEKKNLMHPIYGYEEEMLKLNGLARYDGLKSNDKKFILITPTWRRNVVTLGIAYKKKPYNEHFKHTEYFRLYNTLINDSRLIDCAKKTGYKIIYLLHPAMSPQLEDFTQNGFVEVVPAAGDMSYEKILTEASLMVTDYSGVQFDFAYMRKPIIYYHPDTLPPHYESGGIDYPTQGFGPIITNHEGIVSEICKYMENSCKTEAKYIDRANDFFEFDDFNNCERIYKEILNFLK